MPAKSKIAYLRTPLACEVEGVLRQDLRELFDVKSDDEVVLLRLDPNDVEGTLKRAGYRVLRT